MENLERRTGAAMARSLFVSALYLIAAVVDLAQPLRMVMMDVPTAANQGESVELSCIYDLDKDRLYSIKWYKNDIEFYRYVPNDWPPGQFLPLPGVNVDLSKSGKRSVYLRNVDLNSAGTYRCEVSAEAPSFQSVVAERVMNVMVLPTEGPRIFGGQSKYDVGDTVSLNCTSAKSKPAATLRWFINDQLVDSDYDTEYSTTLHANGLETSSLTLKFGALDRHFVNRNMRLKCTASIARMYTMSNEEVFVGGRQQSSTLEVSEDRSKATDTTHHHVNHNYNVCIRQLPCPQAKPPPEEKPVRGASSTDRKGSNKLQSSAAAACSCFPIHHWLFLLAFAFLQLRIT